MEMTLNTAYGNRYIINEKGQIKRTDMPFNPSDSWKLLGIQHVVTGKFIPFSELPAFLSTKPDMALKNKKPMYTVRDLDHGTTRVWGNTDCHGIQSISLK